VSIGMLVDVRGWGAEPALVAGLTLGILLLKGVLVFSIARWFRLGTRIAALAGLAVGQVGEFSFVLASEGRKLDLVPVAHYQTFLSVSVLTMALTPFLLMLGPWLAGRTGGRAESGAEHDTRKGHAIVVGYGVAGRNVAAVLRQMNVPPLVLELNPRTIRQIREAGGEASFGDAGREEVLQHAGIAGARAVILTALDPVATRQSVATIRRLNAKIEVIVRTRFVVEIEELRRLGATAVVPEEFESSIALAALTMERFGATPDAVARYERALRGRGDYSLVREDAPESTRDATVARILRAAAFDEVAVTAASAGKTLRGLSLRARTGALVIGVRRGDEFLPAPGPDDPLTPGDALIVVARPHEAEAARNAL
jgi:CPA2 family monovalent cation:H+ antiporter-2